LWHWALTSEDVNNASYALLLKRFSQGPLNQQISDLLEGIGKLSEEGSSIPMMSHTHGQAATPTTFGKEMSVLLHRLCFAARPLLLNEDPLTTPFRAKWNGAVGNYNAWVAAHPEADWPLICRRFVEDHLGLAFAPISTQIESHDRLCLWLKSIELFSCI